MEGKLYQNRPSQDQKINYIRNERGEKLRKLIYTMTIMIKDTCKYAATEKYSPWKTNKVDKIVGHKQSNAEEGNHP